jgi:mono/diheme cytochrome c family protein
MYVGLPEPTPAPPAAEPAPAPDRHGLHWTGRYSLAAAPLALAALAWGTGAVVHNRMTADAGTKLVVPTVAASTPSGPRLYAEHCARCHGPAGDGNGLAHLDPPARYFGFEEFKFASTTNKIPSDDDLIAVLRRGIPGSSMPSFAALSEDDLRAVIDHVRRLTRAGRYERLYRKAKKEFDDGEGDPPNPAALHAKAYEQTVPGAPLVKPKDIGVSDAESLANGRKVYERVCLSCHGPHGHGDGPQVATMKDDLGRPIRPRNLTFGVYKGGHEVEHLHARIMLGIPGTPMPASGTTLPAADVEDLIHYIRSLAPPPAKETPPAMTAAK